MNDRTLKMQNLAYRGTLGLSENNRRKGFLPAFRHDQTGHVQIACRQDGSACSFHLIDWLPLDWALEHAADGRVLCLAPGVTAGFVRDGVFYTREEAADAEHAGD